MSAFYMLNSISRALILLLFLILILSNFIIFGIVRTHSRRLRTYLTAFFSMLLFYILLVIISTAFHKRSIGQELAPLFVIFADLPVIIYLILLLVGGIGSFFLLYYELQYQKKTITQATIEESINNLPACLCFATEKGLILLANHSMENLNYTLTGYDLQDADDLWNIVTKGELKGGARRFVGATSPIIHLADGETWSFTRRIIKVKGIPVVQIAAVNITDLEALRMRLQEDNERLVEMGRRLRRYSEDVIEVKAREERLATKMRLHDELGYSLLATQHLLGHNKNDIHLEENAGKILALWQRNIAALYGVAVAKKTTALDTLITAAQAIGIKICLQGNLPEDSKILNLILTGAGECLTNAVRHARATELFLDISTSAEAHKAIFYNNGIIPKGPIIEGGGLSSLRRKVLEMNGTMEVNHQPRFSITITIPK